MQGPLVGVIGAAHHGSGVAMGQGCACGVTGGSAQGSGEGKTHGQAFRAAEATQPDCTKRTFLLVCTERTKRTNR